MAHHKSAIKSMKQAEKRRLRNKSVKTRVKNVTNQVRTVASSDPQNGEQVLRNAVREISRAASKGVIPKRRASRKVSRLTRLLNASKQA